MIYRFWFCQEWCDEKGRFWAEPLEFDSAVDARKAHKGAMAWMWVGDKVRPSVSDLYSVAYREDPDTGKKREENRTVIQDGGQRGYREATLPRVRPSSERIEVPGPFAAARTSAKPDSDATPF